MLTIAIVEDDLEYQKQLQKYIEQYGKEQDCRHLNERDCGIKNAVENGEIPPSRYESYRVFYEYLKQKENEYK